MPLNEQEKQHFFEILKCLLPEDALSLARTILKDQVKILRNEEAIQAILAYTHDAQELFKRKKLKKEHLFQYLYNKGINNISPSAEKNILVKRILEYWGSDDSFEEMEDDDSLAGGSFNTTHQEDARQQEIEVLNCWADRSLVPDELDREFAVEFCRWFYVMLNEAKNNNLNTPDGAFNNTHFFEDCNMRFLVKQPQEMKIESYVGANEVSSRLLKLVGEENVVFNPNLSERGVKTLCDAYGRKVIIVAGTIHCGEFIGLFEQHFGLVRDPKSDFTWKIKFTRISFLTDNSSQNVQEPVLEFTKNMLI